MALFKIFKGNGKLDELNTKIPQTTDGFCYFTPDDGKFYIDIYTDQGNEQSATDPKKRIILNAGHADTAGKAANLDNITTAANVPVYFNNGLPVQVAQIPSNLIGDLSDRYLSTNGGTVTGDIVAETFIGNLTGIATMANVADFATGAQDILTNIDFTSMTPIQCYQLHSTNDVINILHGYYYLETSLYAAAPDGMQALPCITYIIKDGTQLRLYQELMYYDGNIQDDISDAFIGPITRYYRTNSSSQAWTEWEEIKNSLEPAGDSDTPIYINADGEAVPCSSLKGYLPLTAGEDYKLTGPLGLDGVMYGSTLPESGFEGQLFFLEDNETGLPIGGTAGQVLIKNSSADGDAYWSDVVALPEGGKAGQALIKNSTSDGDASWKDIVALPKGGSTGQIIVKNSATEGDASWQDFPELNYIPMNPDGIELYPASATAGHGGYIDFHYNGNSADHTSRIIESAEGVLQINGNTTVTMNGILTATKVYGAVYNDYAEFRDQKEFIEPGYCVASTDNGQIYKTTEKFQACDGIVSDTFGFAIGETDKCKTPLAVAGRVLAYYEGNREDYHSGDTVCAGPNGKICKMTREEIREWPDRIIGIVSEIPNYDTWGSNNIQVNNRIWIKVK